MTDKKLKTLRFGMVISPEEIEDVDQWRIKQPDIPSRSEAIRRLVKMSLESQDK